MFLMMLIIKALLVVIVHQNVKKKKDYMRAMIPIVNFLVMPVAICGATAMWVNEYRSDVLSRR